MRDLPDFYSHVSPSFSSIRPDQTLQMISWNVDVDADSSSTKHTDIDLPGKLFVVDSVHLFSNSLSSPFRFELKINDVSYVSAYVEGSDTINLLNFAGACIKDVVSVDETVYNDSYLTRSYKINLLYFYSGGA